METEYCFGGSLDSPWTYFALAGLLAVVAVASQFRLQNPSRPVGTIDDLAELADPQAERRVHRRRHAAGGPAQRLRLRAPHEPGAGRPRSARCAIRAGRGAVELDQDVDGVALDGAVPDPDRRAAFEPRHPERGGASRGALRAGRLRHGGHLAQRVGRPGLRVPTGVRHLSACAPDDPAARLPEEARSRPATRQRRGRHRGGHRVPRDPRAAAVPALSALHGRAPVRIRRSGSEPRFRRLALGLLRRRHSLGRPQRRRGAHPPRAERTSRRTRSW